MKEFHQTQLEILNKLIHGNSLRYTQMKPRAEMENNIFQFHLNKLIKEGLVTKEAENYHLTQEGKKYAIRLDSDTSRPDPQAKIGVALGCVRQSGGESQILMYTRLKQAYYGCQGLPAGKVKQGELIVNAAARELKEETGLIGDAQIKGVIHYQIKEKGTFELLDDLLLFFCRFDDPTGKLSDSREGRYEWVPVSSMLSFVRKPFQTKKSLLREIEIIRSDLPIAFFEEVFLDNKKF